MSATTAAFTSGMNRVQDTAADAALSLRRLSFASESAESNLDEVGRSAFGASGGMTTFMATTEGAGFAVNGLSSSILLSLVPALVTLAGALTPIVFALGGLVSIGAAIGGVGLVGLIGAIATRGEELKTVFNVLLDTIASEFAPVFDAAAAVLFSLMGALTDTIGELVPAKFVLQEIAGNFLNLGRALIDALPAFMDLATTLAVEFLPPFVDLLNNILPQIPGMVMDMVRVFREVAPIFMDFGRALGRFMPELLEFGMSALPVVAESLGIVAGYVQDALVAFNGLEGSVQDVLLAGSLILPVLTTLVSLLGGPLTLAVAGLAAAFATNFAGIRDTVMKAVGAVERMLGGRGEEALNGFIAAWKAIKPVLEPIVSFFANVLAVSLVNLIDYILTIGEVLGELAEGDLKGALSEILGYFGRWVNRLAELLNQVTGGLLEQFVNGVIDALNIVGTSFDDLAGRLGFEDLINFEEMENVNIGTTPFTPAGGMPQPPQQRRMAQRGALTSGTGQSRREEIVFRGEGPITDAMAEQANEQLSQQQRQTRRNQGRQPNPTR